jgi:hypothetical protein
MKLHNVSAVRKTEIHTANMKVPDPSSFKVETATAELK